MEVITLDELSIRLHVSRATLFNWMQKGIFTQGLHFFKQGRVLRFIWGNDLVTALSAHSQDKKSPAVITKPVRLKESSPLNWNY